MNSSYHNYSTVKLRIWLVNKHAVSGNPTCELFMAFTWAFVLHYIIKQWSNCFSYARLYGMPIYSLLYTCFKIHSNICRKAWSVFFIVSGSQATSQVKDDAKLWRTDLVFTTCFKIHSNYVNIHGNIFDISVLLF